MLDGDDDGSGDVVLPAYVNMVGVRWSDAELTVELGYKCRDGEVLLGKFAMPWVLGEQFVDALRRASEDMKQSGDPTDRTIH